MNVYYFSNTYLLLQCTAVLCVCVCVCVCVCAVSYTHLDVYKRQTLYRSGVIHGGAYFTYHSIVIRFNYHFKNVTRCSFFIFTPTSSDRILFGYTPAMLYICFIFVNIGPRFGALVYTCLLYTSRCV